MAEKRDYYEVLGVAKTASADEIKKAYRAAAMKWHPDRWVDGTEAEKKTAEEKFKEASEAYSVLSDPDKKAKYDQFGFDGPQGGFGGFGGGASMDMNDIFSMFGDIFGGHGGFGGGFGGFGGSAQPQQYQGRDLRVQAKLTLEEAFAGCTKKFKIRKDVTCSACHGTGCEGGSQPETCPTCHGAGTVIDKPCGSCRGSGVQEKSKRVTLTIPAGVDDGKRIAIHGEGDTGKNGGPAGDLIVVLHVEPHTYFERSGQDLYCAVPVTMVQAALGETIFITPLEKRLNLNCRLGLRTENSCA
mgnify:CR=1 FL=1